MVEGGSWWERTKRKMGFGGAAKRATLAQSMKVDADKRGDAVVIDRARFKPMKQVGAALPPTPPHLLFDLICEVLDAQRALPTQAKVSIPFGNPWGFMEGGCRRGGTPQRPSTRPWRPKSGPPPGVPGRDPSDRFSRCTQVVNLVNWTCHASRCPERVQLEHSELEANKPGACELVRVGAGPVKLGERASGSVGNWAVCPGLPERANMGAGQTGPRDERSSAGGGQLQGGAHWGMR